MRRRLWLVSDIDGTLTGSDAALARLARVVNGWEDLGFGVASGRSPELVRQAVSAFGLPEPELVIASVGSEMSGAGRDWNDWPPAAARASFQRERLFEVLLPIEGIALQGPEGQGPWKLSFTASARAAAEAGQRLAEAGLRANLIHSDGQFLDVLPEGVSKGAAVRFFSDTCGVPLSRIAVAGDTGNDLDLLTSGALGILVANHTDELAPLRSDPRVHAAAEAHAAGVLEGLTHHFGTPERPRR